MTLVAGQEPDGRGKARRRRRGAAIAVSLLVHAVVFALIGFNAPRLIAPALPPLDATNVWLIPRLTPEAHKPAEHKTAAPASATPSKTISAKPQKAEAPSPAPAQRAAAPSAPPSGPGAEKGSPPAPAAIQGEGGVQEALRTSVGCDFDKTVHLTPAERDRCNQTTGEQARAAPVFSGIEALKRGRFDDQAAADERRRASRTGPLQQPMPACEGPGSNLGGACLPDSAMAHIHQH
jgi:hypothetical protein